MNKVDKLTLSNGIKVILRINPNTPKSTINFFINSGIKNEKKAGLGSLSSRLLLQGTTSRNSEKLAEEIDLYAIDLRTDIKQDYSKVSAIFLNEDFQKATELMSDIINNSTFDEFEKETRKLKGEIEVDLDSAKTKALDNLIKNMYKNHPYGNTHTRILKELSTITKEEVKEFYYASLSPENIVISAVGDFNKQELLTVLEENFGKIKNTNKTLEETEPSELENTTKVTISKDDAAQAQVIQGWLAPSVLDEEYPTVTLLNTILGSSGLSSRLFVELRDKQGLAYVVRSGYDAMKHKGTFTVYIATEPKNIKVALDGFKSEIKKLQDTPVDEQELEYAKSNILGKREFFHETNSQQAHYLGYYEIIGLGAEYDELISLKLKEVTPEKIQAAAKKYLNDNSVVSLLAPASFLN